MLARLTFAVVMLSVLLTVHGRAHAADDRFYKDWAAAVKAAEPEAEPDVFTKLDKSFGEYVVNPLASVMFFDVMFWDNTLAPGAGIGLTEVASETDTPRLRRVTTHDPEQGYGRQYLYQVAVAQPTVVEPMTVEVADLKVNLQVESPDGERTVMARIPIQSVNPTPYALPAWDPEGPEQPVVETMVPSLGFPIRIDRRTMMTEPSQGPAPASIIPSGPGEPVYVPSMQSDMTLAGGTEGAWRVLDPTVAYDPAPLPNPAQAKMPIVVLWLVLGAVFFTLRMTLINVRGVPHALAVVTGRYDGEHDEGEISHFQALSSALSATVGLGNIAGVALAIGIGGPGAIFWMWCAGFLGMASKFTECTLGQMYRVTDAEGRVSGGPMHYIDRGLAELGLGPIGKVLAVIFALMCIGGSLGGGNMFQANQSLAALKVIIPSLEGLEWVYGVLLMLIVGVVIIGGIKRIAAAASLVVPLMCGLYVAAGVYILAINASEVPAAFMTIVSNAFVPRAGLGGMLGVLAIGFQRASFSNEAGVGSASIAHSAASTDRPVREGVVALLEPFIDTILVCTVTALVMVLSGVDTPESSDITATMAAFGVALPWFPIVLAFAATMFAFSTMVSWSYYGERAVVWLLGDFAITPYRILFLACVFVGSVIKLENVLTFSDLMILGMAFPNILAAVLLSGKVKRALDVYWKDLADGKFAT